MKAKTWFSLNLTAATFFKVKGPLSSLRQFPTTENPSKMMKNAVYFILEPFLLLKYLKFCPNFLVM